jgi:hypothetical protein
VTIASDIQNPYKKLDLYDHGIFGHHLLPRHGEGPSKESVVIWQPYQVSETTIEEFFGVFSDTNKAELPAMKKLYTLDRGKEFEFVSFAQKTKAIFVPLFQMIRTITMVDYAQAYVRESGFHEPILLDSIHLFAKANNERIVTAGISDHIAVLNIEQVTPRFPRFSHVTVRKTSAFFEPLHSDSKCFYQVSKIRSAAEGVQYKLVPARMQDGVVSIEIETGHRFPWIPEKDLV